MLDLEGFGHLLLSGAVITIKLALASLVIGLVFGMLGASAKLSGFKPFVWLATAYTTVMRGIPELLLVLFLYYGGTMLLSALLEKFGYTDTIDINPFWAGVSALSIAFGAYATETLRMAFQEIPKGQTEAAQAMGMKKGQIFWRITLPQVWKLALPGLGNLFLVLLKDTALISVVGLDDIMRHAQAAVSTTHKPFTFFLAAALIYLTMTIIITGIVMWVEWLNNPAERYNHRLQATKLASNTPINLSK